MTADNVTTNAIYGLALFCAFAVGVVAGVGGGYLYLHDEVERRYVGHLNECQHQVVELREQVRQLSEGK